MTKHKVSILWGSFPDDGQKADTYEFDTCGELNAFMTGVDEAAVCVEYEVVEEGYVYKEEKDDD